MKWDRVSLGLLASFGVTSPAFAQDGDDDTGPAWTIETHLVMAVADSPDLPSQAPEADGFSAQGDIVVKREDVLKSGTALTWRFAGSLARDAPGRPSFAGVFGSPDPAAVDCIPGDQNCEQVGGAWRIVSPVSPSTGLSGAGEVDSSSVGVFLEGASLSVASPWGEGVFGYDSGVAARLDARAPQVLDGVSVFSPAIDPWGANTVRARNDITGSSLKVSYMSPRWLGLRAGVSFAPKADLAGADFDPGSDGAGRVGADLDNIVEAAISFSRRFRSSGVRLRAAVTATSAEVKGPIFDASAYSAYGLGLEFDRDAWSGGVRWLSSDNASMDRNDAYEAIEVGLVRDSGDWRLGFEYGGSRDGRLGLKSTSWLVGARRSLQNGVAVGLGYGSFDINLPVFNGSLVSNSLQHEGFLLEMSVRK